MFYLAKDAGEVIRKAFNEARSYEVKDDRTPVTEADIAVHQLVADWVSMQFPDAYLLSEENKKDAAGYNGQEVVFVLDPIDGTMPYISGLPCFSFVLSVLVDWQPMGAVVYNPISDLMIMTNVSGMTTIVGSDARVSVTGTQKLEGAYINTIFWKKCDYKILKVVEKLLNKGAHCFNTYSGAFECALVAAGRLDAVVFPGHNIWEAAAAQCLINGAGGGGKVTDIRGKALDFSKQNIDGFVVSNGKVHDQIIEVIRQVNAW